MALQIWKLQTLNTTPLNSFSFNFLHSGVVWEVCFFFVKDPKVTVQVSANAVLRKNKLYI